MGVVCGPWSLEDWKVMKMLRLQVNYMKTKPTKFGSMLKKDEAKYKEKYLGRTA